MFGNLVLKFKITFIMGNCRKQNLFRQTNGIKGMRQGRDRQGLAQVEEPFDSLFLIILKWDRGSTWGSKILIFDSSIRGSDLWMRN